MTEVSNSVRKLRKRTKYMPPAKSLANLKPYKPGENGHTGGYPLKEMLIHALRKNPERANEIIESTIEGCILREPTPFKEVWDRVEGKVVDKLAVLGDIVIEVVYVNRSARKDTNPDRVTNPALTPD